MQQQQQQQQSLITQTKKNQQQLHLYGNGVSGFAINDDVMITLYNT
jgi:hypothetical protein